MTNQKMSLLRTAALCRRVGFKSIRMIPDRNDHKINHEKIIHDIDLVFQIKGKATELGQ